MLRNAVLAIAIVILAASTLAALAGAVGAWVPIVWSAVVAIAIGFERFRYKPVTKGAPGAGWQRTSERFVDDETGKTVTVYVDPKTGSRQYVEE